MPDTSNDPPIKCSTDKETEKKDHSRGYIQHESPLRPIQFSTEVSGALHELLVLLLLHLELSLSLDADGIHVATSPHSVGPELSLSHAAQEAARLLIVDDAGAVCNYSDLAIGFRRLFDGEHGFVYPVVW